MPDNAILVVGSLNMDQIVRVPRVPVLGETLLGAGSLRLVPGGKGANQAVAMARLGAPVAMAGRIGQDPFGERLLASLQADHVDTDLIVLDATEASGTAFIFLTADGDNAIVVASGANIRVGVDQHQMRRITTSITRSQAVVMQLEIPLATVISLAEVGHKAGVPVVLNLAPAQPLPQETLRQLTLLVVNETEASLLSGQRVETLEDARIVATVLREQGIKQVVITLGAQGALLAVENNTVGTRTIYQPSPKVQVVDTTAAGDCFAGALTVALTERQSPEEALKFAVFASALKVTKFGAQSGLPTRTEVEDFIRSTGA
ncbi:MAG TPA: ribokinase [Ktedonobacteraceae bacterium]|nr:ribokinase [Ktedonobacteraceae bacterium]